MRCFRGRGNRRQAGLLGGDLLDGHVVEFELWIFFDEVAHGPIVWKEDDGVFKFIGPETHAAGDDERGGIGERGMWFEPFEERPGCRLEARFGVVLGFEAPLDDFKLQWADGGEERRAGRGVAGVEGLYDAFLQQLL